MDYEYTTKKVGGFTVTVALDTYGDTESPREWRDGTTFVTDMRRYTSPDEWKGNSLREWLAGEFNCDERRLEWVMEREAVALPVYTYEHGAVLYRASYSNPFNCPWDSGLSGLIYMTKKQIRKEYSCKIVTKRVREKVIKRLKSEVDVYSDWANGSVYYYRITDKDGDEVDSCYGFIGDPEYALSEGVSLAEHYEMEARQARTTKLKEMIRHRAPLEARQAVLA